MRIKIYEFQLIPLNQSDKIILGHIPPPYQEQNY